MWPFLDLRKRYITSGILGRGVIESAPVGVACHNGSMQRAGMAIGRRVQQWFIHVSTNIYAGFVYTRYGWEGLGGLGMGCQWLAGLVYDRGKIMTGSSDNSGSVVVGALVCGTECSGFKSRFML